MLAVENGGAEVGCSDRHYGQPKNMIKVSNEKGTSTHTVEGYQSISHEISLFLCLVYVMMTQNTDEPDNLSVEHTDLKAC